MNAFCVIYSVAGKGADGIEVTWQGRSSGRKRVYSWVILLYSVCFYRNVPAAWSTRRHLNTFTHSSSLMEVKKNYMSITFYKVIISRKESHILFLFFADASMYAHYLFNAFDTTNNGSIKFKVKKQTNKQQCISRPQNMLKICIDAMFQYFKARWVI